jgi:diguanylate cyclase (GGDEF)-like protein/PAS domain S-box-containing protein
LAIQLRSPQSLSLTQWQVWAVLLLAAACAHLSLSVHYAERDLGRAETVMAELDGLLSDPGTRQNAQWLVDAHRLVPAIATFRLVSSSDLEASLDALTERAKVNAIEPSDFFLVKRELHWIAAETRALVANTSLKQVQFTHLYYWSVIAFVVVLMMLPWRRESDTTTPVSQLMTDDVLFPNAPIAMTVSDGDDRLLRVNAAFEQLTGFSGEELQGQSAQSEDSGRHDLSFVDDMRRALSERGRWSGEYWLRHRDGSAFSEKVMRVALGDSRAPEGYLTLSMDPVISDDERRLMLWQAHHDNLTKLPNANLLHERLARALVAIHQEGGDALPDSHHEGKRGALISIDIDNFQMVNDSVGYTNGDRVLMDAAYRIAMCARETDTVARMGGDQFVIVLNEIDDVGEPERVARAAVEQIAAPFHADDKEFFLTASVGIAIFPDDGTEKGELLQKADAARMNAKAQGGSGVAFFEDEMNDAAARRMEIETHLRKAITQGELDLHYQPIMDIARGEIYGAEALLRWQNADLGMVSPGEFIPVAEDSGLIVEIGQWVIGEVHRQLEAWRAAGMVDIRVSLNVSARQVRDEATAQAVLDTLAKGPTNQVTVEVTESAVVEDLPGPKLFMAGVKDLGIRVALDDFGTGYSSVGYLRDFEFDVLKVDKSFIDELGEARDYGLVASIVSMGRILGMRVVAEGVEEQAQLERLRQIGCDYIQGYYYSKPLCVADFEQFISQHSMQSAG